MMTNRFNYKCLSIGTFLVLGTILSLIISIDTISDFTHLGTLIARTPIMTYLLLFDFIVLFPISGLISTYSFFTKGKIWIVITKGIILNIMVYIFAGLWLIISSFCCSKAYFIIIGLCLLCTGVLWCIWRSVNKVN